MAFSSLFVALFTTKPPTATQPNSHLGGRHVEVNILLPARILHASSDAQYDKEIAAQLPAPVNANTISHIDWGTSDSWSRVGSRGVSIPLVRHCLRIAA